MKKTMIALISITLSISIVSVCAAEEWNSLFKNAFSNIESVFDSETSDEKETADEKSWLENIVTIADGLFASETGIPKEIHYGDYELFKQDIDTLEVYFQTYADFMRDYDPADISMLADYTALLARYTEAMEVLEALDITKMSQKEEAYYLSSLNRINQILIDVLDEI